MPSINRRESRRLAWKGGGRRVEIVLCPPKWFLVLRGAASHQITTAGGEGQSAPKVSRWFFGVYLPENPQRHVPSRAQPGLLFPIPNAKKRLSPPPTLSLPSEYCFPCFASLTGGMRGHGSVLARPVRCDRIGVQLVPISNRFSGNSPRVTVSGETQLGCRRRFGARGSCGRCFKDGRTVGRIC